MFESDWRVKTPPGAAWNGALVSVALIGATILGAYISPGLTWRLPHPRHWLILLLCLYAILWAGCFLYQMRRVRKL
jgi:hypothetical protein